MKNLREYASVSKRRQALEKVLDINLPHVGTFSLSETDASTRHCENMVGVTQIPLGIAGPLIIKRIESVRKSHYIPLATTEGALVASINRGCKAITESGGAVVDSYRVGTTRGPVFKVKDLRENDRLNTFLEKDFAALQKLAQKTSSHLWMTRYFSRGLGRYRYVRFIFDTQDAMGMNMATIATEKVVRYIEEKTGAQCVSLAGNYDVDKKGAWLNVIEGRGTKVWAEIMLPEKVLKKILKTSAPKMYEVWLVKCMLGSAMAGSLGFNAHYANVIAAMFIATGQDPAHVVEGSLGVTTTEVVSTKTGKEDLYVSVYLPDLMVGTIGGGTGLATQKEALSMLGVAGGNNGQNSRKLAEIVGAAVLAGEISLLASLAEGSLVRAHQILGRGKG